MGKRLIDITFEEWLNYVFDHPVTDPAWYWDIDDDLDDGPPATTVDYMTQLFENAASVLRPFSDAQVNQGLNYLVNSSCSSYVFALLDQDVAWPDRYRCIQSIYTLFESCLAVRCSEHLSHLDETGANPLNDVTYMWWDVIPICGEPDNKLRRKKDKPVLGVLQQILSLNSLACQESALHGLGHWHPEYPQQVNKIIDSFLAKHRRMRPELEQYAIDARRGYVN